MEDTPFREIPAPPATVTAGTVLARLAQGIGFRYRWATEGLAPEDLTFRPVQGSKTLGELLEHIHGLIRRSAVCAGLNESTPGIEPPAGFAIRRATLDLAAALAARFEAMTDVELAAMVIRNSRGETFPFWHLVNGPLSDSLTHIGQIASWRRILGNPVPGADVFRGRPPAGWPAAE